MNRHASIRLGAAFLACAAAALLFGRALVGALTVDTVAAPSPGMDADAVDATAADAARRPLSGEALMLAVDADPFQPDRRRHPSRYRLPGDVEPPPPPRPPPPPPPPPFRLIGTGVTGGGGVAVIEVEQEARVLSVGETYLGYTLMAVEADNATMLGAEQAVRLPLVASVGAGDQAGAARGPAGRMGAPGRGGPGQQLPGNLQGRGGAAGAPDLRELVERIRAGGGALTPQMLEMLQRMQAEGRDVRIETGTGGNVMIRTTRPDTTDAQAPGAP